MKQIVRSVLAACLVVSPGSGAAAQIPGLSAADSKELASYRLTMDAVNKVQVATRALVAEMLKDPEVKNDTGDLREVGSIDEMEAQIRKHPRALAAFKQAGLSPREYSKFMMTMALSGMIAAVHKAGMRKSLPKEYKQIHPDNVKFVIDHQAELEAMQNEFKSLRGNSSSPPRRHP